MKDVNMRKEKRKKRDKEKKKGKDKKQKWSYKHYWKEHDASVQQADNEMIRCENLVKIYKTEEIEVMALQGLDLVVEKGELMAVIGNSGSGKSTLMNMIGGLEKPSAGRLYVNGKDLFRMSEKELIVYKRNTVGFVWQNNARNLFPYLTAKQNVAIPMLLDKQKKPDKRAEELLEMVGLLHKKDRFLKELSGGEQQRVAIAIALANNPSILLADEPTGAVDGKTSDQILELFRRLNEQLHITIIIVTHDPNLAAKVNRVVRIRDGKISSEQVMKESVIQKLREVGDFTEETKKEMAIELTHDEYAILDRNGRVQISQEMLEKMNMKGNQLKLEMQDGKIVLSNPNS